MITLNVTEVAEPACEGPSGEGGGLGPGPGRVVVIAGAEVVVVDGVDGGKVQK